MDNSLLDRLFRFLRMREIIKYIPKESVVCDIGCGLELYLLTRIKHNIKKGVGLDLDLKDHTENNLELRNIKINDKLPLENNFFDIVTMAAFLEHLDNPGDILKEAFRIVKIGGMIVLTTPSPLAKPILNFLVLTNLIDKREILDHKNYFWPKNVKRMLVQAGFKPEKIKSKFFEFFTNTLVIATK